VPRKPRRRIVLAIVVALLLVAALIVRHLSRPEALTTMLINNAKSQLGAELVLGETGRFGFVPDLHLTLAHPALKAPGQAAAFLSADSADVVVPWSTLSGDRLDIQSIDLVKPRLDIDALNAWLDSRPASAPPPDVRFALRAKDALVIASGKTIAENVDLDFASSGDIAGWLTRQRDSAKTSTLLPPLDGTIDAATIEYGDTRLEGVRIESRDDAGTKAVPGKPAQ
ncbi:MAG: hypothetical protein ACREPX_10345, partial [Rhodanobacteraceae bacterium]